MQRKKTRIPCRKNQQNQQKKDKKGSTAAPSDSTNNDPPPKATSDSDSLSDDDETFTTRFWDRNMPIAKGIAAKTFRPDMCTQLQGALDLLHFLSKPNVDFNLLDLDTTITPCILAAPGSGQRNVRIVYGLGTGAAATGIKNNNLHSNFLTLSGELEDGVSIPNVMTLPPSIATLALVKVPTIKDFESACLTKSTKVSSWFKKSALTIKANILQVMPTPAFLILDALDTNIDALVIYERWNSIKDSLVESERMIEYDHALTSFLFDLRTTQENTIKVKQSVFMSPPSQIAQKWKNQRLHQLFHNHQTVNTSTPTPSQANFVNQVAQAVVEKQGKVTKVSNNVEEMENKTNKPSNTEQNTFEDIATKK